MHLGCPASSTSSTTVYLRFSLSCPIPALLDFSFFRLLVFWSSIITGTDDIAF